MNDYSLVIARLQTSRRLFRRTKILSNAHGDPPRCVCPSVVTRVSNPSRSVNTSLIYSARMGWSKLSCAPSATMTMVFRFPISRCYDVCRNIMSGIRREEKEKAHAMNLGTHVVLPRHHLRWSLRYENEIGTTTTSI